VIQVNEETGNRRPVMLSVLTKSEKETQATAGAAAAADTDGEANQSPKGTKHIDAVSLFPVVYS